MGVSKNVYVGPFVRVKLIPTTYAEEIDSCTFTKCAQHRRPVRSPFCSECGSRVGPVTVTNDGVRGWHDFDESVDYKYDGVLWAPEYLGGNDEQVLLDESRWEFDENEDTVRSLTGVDVQALIEEFETERAEMLKEAREYFGDNITVDYGVCSYWS